MAALTAATGPYRENLGSVNQVRWTFTGVNTGDTFASGMTSGITTFVATQTDTPSTQASAGLCLSNSSGTFTFLPGEDGAAITLMVNFKG